VLSGLLGAHATRIDDPFRVSSVGAYIHGAAGNLAASELGEYYMSAGDIIGHLSQALPHK
jgi:NAD(P)H-hydrate epimerase